MSCLWQPFRHGTKGIFEGDEDAGEAIGNPPTPSAVERVGTNSKSIFKSIFKRSEDPREPDPGARGSVY